jgi:serine/threonine-protein kinase HipA
MASVRVSNDGAVHSFADRLDHLSGAKERAAFAYDESWLAASDRFALEPGLPLVAGAQFHRKTRDGSVFHAALAAQPERRSPRGSGRCTLQSLETTDRNEQRRELPTFYARAIHQTQHATA